MLGRVLAEAGDIFWRGCKGVCHDVDTTVGCIAVSLDDGVQVNWITCPFCVFNIV